MVGGVTTSYTYAANRLQSLSGGTTRTNGFDAAGNITGDGTFSFIYDGAGRLIQIKKGNKTTITNAFNAVGQRVKKVGTATTFFAYDENGHLLGEYDSNGVLIQEYVWLQNLPVAILKRHGTGTPVTVDIFYLHSDHLGSVRVVTRPSDNKATWRWDPSEAFGNSQPNTNPNGLGVFSLNLRFPGQYVDSETGLNYSYSRDYDPLTGRFLQSDPIGLRSGISTYSYALNSPTNYYDPFGLDVAGRAIGGTVGSWVGGAIGGAIGTAVEPGGGTAVGATLGRAIGARAGAAAGNAIEEMRKETKCPPCRLVSGTVVPLGAIAYRYDYHPPDVVEHGIAGEHFNLYKANQNPKGCKCFWQPMGAKGPPMDPNWIPIAPFAN